MARRSRNEGRRTCGEDHRHPEFNVAGGVAEPVRHHADDLHGPSVHRRANARLQRGRPADHARIGAEVAAPGPRAQHDDVAALGHVTELEGATEHRRGTRQLEPLGGRETPGEPRGALRGGRHHLGSQSVAAIVESVVVRFRHSRNSSWVVVRRLTGRPATVGVTCSVRRTRRCDSGYGSVLRAACVDDAVDRPRLRCRPRKPRRPHSRRSEPGFRPQPRCRVRHVAAKVLEPGQRARVPMPLLRLLGSAQRHPRRSTSLVW